MHSTENENNTGGRVDLAAMREKLAGQNGKRYWRSLEEFSDTPEFDQFMADEFPHRATLAQLNRRDLLKFMGASIALAGLSGCRGVFLPEDKVVPYVKQPEEMVLGKPLYYATAAVLGAYATGVLVEQHEGRPTEIAGNPEHPASLGAVDIFTQAEILNFYDPDRSGNVTNKGDISTWELFQSASNEALAAQAASKGAGIRILTGGTSSPTFVDLLDRFLAKYPAAKWHAYEPTGRQNVYEGTRLVFGRPLEPVYNFKKAKVIVSLDGDFLSPSAMPGSLRYARDFSDGRRVLGDEGVMNRLYSVESSPGLVGAQADHRWPVKASEVHVIALALASALGVMGASGGSTAPIDPNHFAALVRDLQANPGAALIVTGDHQPPEVHALVHAINAQLGGIGGTVSFIEPVDATANPKVGTLRGLVDDLNAGAVQFLLIIGNNPVYSAPVDYNFAAAIKKAKFQAHLGLHDDETAEACDWHLPLTHTLEEWGDARAYDGTISIMQPLMAPLFDGRSATETLSQLLGNPIGSYDLVRGYWKRTGFEPKDGPMAGERIHEDFEKAWRIAVHDGLIKNSALTSMPFVRIASVASLRAPAPVPAGLELNFRPDPCVYDGRFANNGWLQELPKPLTKLTWDNTVLVSPKQAEKLGVVSDDLVDLKYKGRTVRGAIFMMPGHTEDAVTVHLGYGRTRGGVVATVTDDFGGGFNAYSLRTEAAPYFDGGIEITKVGGQINLASTQGHSPIEGDRIGEGMDIVRVATLAEFNAKKEKALIPDFRQESSEEIASQNMYPEEVFEWNGPQWGMTIDMNTCIGCNACVIACQSENNIPVVGKTQVKRHREMHWLRIDRYYSGTDENPQIAWQPMMCVHCEKAPCEPVCPVAATVHSHEGLNQMIYNRCVGTRYCSNNCPYKVRRFNYLNYSDNQKQFDVRIDDKPRIPLLKMLNSPDVTVRGRGVMEKCTYCVQRINDARIEAKKADRPIKDGEIVTACQQACPTNTIVFGNIADKDSQVSKLRTDPRGYKVLEELQTRPRTIYLAKLRNPNPEIQGAAGGHA